MAAAGIRQYADHPFRGTGVVVFPFGANGVAKNDAENLYNIFASELDKGRVFTFIPDMQVRRKIREYKIEVVTSTETAIELGRELGATHVVWGTVGKTGSQYLATVFFTSVGSNAGGGSANCTVDSIEELVKHGMTSLANDLLAETAARGK